MKISQYGLEHLKQSEGSRSKMYKDSAGYPTIGVGHLLTRSERNSGRIHIDGLFYRWRNGLSDKQITSLLDRDLNRFEESVTRHIKVELTQHQFDALVSFSFNVGAGAFKRSTLLKRINAKRFADVPAQFRRWNRAGGKVIRGLKNRREREIRLWLRKDDE